MGHDKVAHERPGGVARCLAALILVAVWISSGATHADVGNLGWVDADPSGSAEGATGRLRLQASTAIGRADFDRGARAYIGTPNADHAQLSVGVVVRLLPASRSLWDVSALATVAGGVTDWDEDGASFLGCVGPEVGLTLPNRTGPAIRTFASMAAGLSRHRYPPGAYSFQGQNKWNRARQIRVGLEVGARDASAAVVIGVQFIHIPEPGGLPQEETRTLAEVGARLSLP